MRNRSYILAHTIARTRVALPYADSVHAIFRRKLDRGMRTLVYKPRRAAHSNKLATVLTTVQADICDGKLWTKGENESEREREKAPGGMVGLPLDARRCVFLGYFIYELFHLSSVF